MPQNFNLNKKGFTLVELLLAISIFGVIAIALYSTFMMGIRSWRKMDVLMERYQEVRLVLERMGRELRNCVDMDIKDFYKAEYSSEIYDLKGEKDRIVFFTLKPEGIKIIVYRKEDVKDNEGKIIHSILKRKESDFRLPPYEENTFTGETFLDLLSSKEGIEFKYLKGKKNPDAEAEWQERWGEGEGEKDRLPSQIGIKIVFLVPTGRDDEYQEVTVNKYVDLVTVPKMQSSP